MKTLPLFSTQTLLIPLFVLFAFSFGHAQIEKDTLQAGQYYQKADSLRTNKEYESSIEYFKKALPIYEKSKAWERVASCYNNISFSFWGVDELESSIKYAKNALKICKEYLSDGNLEEALAYDNLGLCYEEKLEYERALKLYKKSLSIKQKILPANDPSIGTSYLNIGEVAKAYNNFDMALEFYKKDLKINLNARGENHEYTANSYNNVGAILLLKGEYEKALLYHKKALKVKKTLFGENSYEASISYNNLGLIYDNIGKNTIALEYLNRTISIREKLLGKEHSKLIGPYHNVGLVYGELKDFKRALEFNNKGLSIILKLVGENHIYTAKSYENLADHYLAQTNYDYALEYFLKSLKIYISFLGEKNAIVASAYDNIGLTYFKMKQYENAIKFYNKSINANLKNDFKNDFDSNNFLDLNVLLSNFNGKAKTYSSIYKEEKEINTLNKAIALFDKVDGVIDKIRGNFKNHQDKIVFAETAKETYKGAVEAQILLYQHTYDPVSLEKAFYYTEKSKANTLKELLTTAKSFTGLPKEVVALEKTFKTDRAFYQSRIHKEESDSNGDSLKIKEYENQLFKINRRQDSLTAVLEKDYPKYYQLKYQNKTISIGDIQQQLDNQTTVLEFFTADSVTYAFTISKNDFALQQLATKGLTRQIEAYRKSIVSQDLQTYKEKGYELFQKLIDPIQEKLIGDQLIIIPDGPLWHLNFESLLTQKESSNNPKNLSYLLNNYAISYANSGSLLFDRFKEKNTAKSLQECLAFSFSAGVDSKSEKSISLAALRDLGDDLPGTRKEIKAISNIIDGQYYYGSQAIEANFKKNASNYNILHLALHGEVDHERPENSKLYFTKTKDTLEDNLLYSHELFAMDIPAELAVLSACNTGTGKIAKGEGIMSLGNAFQYAGAKSLLLTRWEVSDHTTPEIMKYFYINLKSGMNKGKALQQAKLQYLETADINRLHPFYWSSFYLVGDSTPMHFEDHSLLYWVLGTGGMIVLLLFGWWYRRKFFS
ncbi:CHAT domain-containing protein [Aquimarina sp. 2201CG1-2-11]|uniref:CHAT domain-containing protein n=1 Tax=Aquimarina discodermiae TaxID=3231043 RepID=UPI003463393B